MARSIDAEPDGGLQMEGYKSLQKRAITHHCLDLLGELR